MMISSEFFLHHNGIFLYHFLNSNKEQFIIQSYIPEVKKGDKRIVLIDGEVVGAINRIPAKNENRSNMHVGGKPIKTSLNKTKIEKVFWDKVSTKLMN